jgi:hypothetical protein
MLNCDVAIPCQTDCSTNTVPLSLSVDHSLSDMRTVNITGVSDILPLYSQYILSLLLFVVKNVHLFRRNSTIHSFNTRQCSELYLPPVHLTKVQKGVYHFGVKVFNGLPFRIKDLSSDVKKFKLALKEFFLAGSY